MPVDRGCVLTDKNKQTFIKHNALSLNSERTTGLI